MAKEIIRFGDFELDPGAFELRQGEGLVRLERIPLELLIFLAEKRGQLATREEILERIWGKDVFVDADNSINTAVRKIRLALKEDPENPRFLRTVPAKGYRFAAELVTPASEQKPAAVSHSPVVKEQSVNGTGKSVSRYLWLTLAASAVIAFMIASPRIFHRTKSPAVAKMKLVVLPFVNLSGDPEQEYLADGMTEEIITQLGGLDPEHLGVIARTSSMHYKGTKEDAGQIARELGVNYLLEGSMRRDGSRVRIAAQLIQASDQTHVWAGNFEQNQSDILKLESDLALAISSKTALTLSPAVRAHLSAPGAVNEEAFAIYLTAKQSLASRTKDGMERSIAEYQRAISLEPNYAPPYAELATAYSLASVVGLLSTQQAMPKAREAAQRAILLDESLSAGHTALGFVLAHYDFDWPGAQRELQRGIALNPSDANAHFFYSNSFLSLMGRHDEAIVEMKRALELDPLAAPMQSFAGQTFLWAKKYDQALAQLQQCAERFPGFAINYERIAHMDTYMGRFEDAITQDTRAKILSGQTPEAALRQDVALRKALGAEGPKGYWRKLLEYSALPDNPPESYRYPQQLAVIYTRLGEPKKALTLLETAYDERTLGLAELAVEPAFEPLHSEPRFQELLRRLGLPLSGR
jgi:TolB-like protein/DNA-binding winged helix-turn-helix (wHTH) protein/Tfp pilus assembly protein PilF